MYNADQRLCQCGCRAQILKEGKPPQCAQCAMNDLNTKYALRNKAKRIRDTRNKIKRKNYKNGTKVSKM